MVEDYDIDEEEGENQESFAYADYSGVVVMIQTYYYRMVEAFRQYYLNVIKQRDHIGTRQQIQSYIVTLTQLLKRYNSVNSDKDIKEVLKQIDDFVNTQATMNFKKLYECVNMISNAHNILGLNKIEFDKRKELPRPKEKWSVME